MRLLLAALAITFAIAVTASVFAVWASVADAPWEDSPAPPPVESEPVSAADREPAFNASDVVRIVQAEVGSNDSSWPAGARSMRCVSADFLPGNGKWVVKCEYFDRDSDSADTDSPFATSSYVMDDETGHINLR